MMASVMPMNLAHRRRVSVTILRGSRFSFRLIENKIEVGEATPPLIRLLPDIAGERTRSVLEHVAGSDSADLRQAAGECIDLLDRIEELDKP